MKRKPPGAGVPLLIAVASFAAFLAIVVLLESSADLKGTRAGRTLFAISYFTLLAIELVMYHRVRTAMAYRSLIRRGGIFVVGTRRKGWYPLLRAISESPLPRELHFVWWRERSGSALEVLHLRCPPADLPFAVIVTPEGLSFVALGDLLRRYRRKPIAANARAAIEAIAARSRP